MSIKSLMNYTFVSKYARWSEEDKRRETWNEAADRVEQMMLDKYVPEDTEEYAAIKEEIKWAYDMMRKKRVLGSQRALQFGGKPSLNFFRNVCIFCFAAVALVFLCKSTILPNYHHY